MAGKVVIVGGGYIGSELAQALDSVANVTLVEARDAFVHTPATIRAVVKPDLLNQAILPYDRLLRNGKVLRGGATSVAGSGVTLSDGTLLPADFIVLATGSRYAAPFKPDGDSVATLRSGNRDAHARLREASRIAIVGAGAVGTELAGEIRSAMPGKSVTLVSDEPLFFPGYPRRLETEIRRKLDMLGVEIVAGQRAVNLPTSQAPFEGDLELVDGRRIAADLVFPVTGARPVTDLFRTLPDTQSGPDGRILTDHWMRPSSLPNVFAAGDAADNGDAMTIVGASRQTPWLARVLRALLAGKTLERQTSYKPWHNPPILLPLGEHVGSSSLPFGVVGNAPTRFFKGKSLFLPKYRKQFGLT